MSAACIICSLYVVTCTQHIDNATFDHNRNSFVQVSSSVLAPKIM